MTAPEAAHFGASATRHHLIITGGDAPNARLMADVAPPVARRSPPSRSIGGFDDFDASRVKVFDN